MRWAGTELGAWEPGCLGTRMQSRARAVEGRSDSLRTPVTRSTGRTFLSRSEHSGRDLASVRVHKADVGFREDRRVSPHRLCHHVWGALAGFPRREPDDLIA